MKPFFSFPTAALPLFLTLLAPMPALADAPADGDASMASFAPQDVIEDAPVHRTTVQTARQVTAIAPHAVYARPNPAGVVRTFGTRRYAGRSYLIVPGQWYPPVWEDPCTVKRTCAIPGVAPWPGVRVDVNSDEIGVTVGPGPLGMNCAPPVPPAAPPRR